MSGTPAKTHDTFFEEFLMTDGGRGRQSARRNITILAMYEIKGALNTPGFKERA